MAEDFEHGDKTEQPTDRRRQEIRERGSVARSVDLNAAASVLAATAVLYFFGSDLTGTLVELLRQSLSAPAWTDLDPQSLAARAWGVARLVARGVLPVIGVLLAAAVAVNAAQVGFLVTTEPLQPNLGRLNPLSGLRRILSLHGTARLVGSLLKLIVLA